MAANGTSPYYDGDTQLGKRNDCFLVMAATTDRDTWDAEAKQICFRRDTTRGCGTSFSPTSRTTLKRCAANFRSVMTNGRISPCSTMSRAATGVTGAFNKSGYLKYIAPATRGCTARCGLFISTPCRKQQKPPHLPCHKPLRAARMRYGTEQLYL